MRIWPIIRSFIFPGATKGRVREPRTKKSWTPVSAIGRHLSLLPIFFRAQGSRTNNEGQYHLPIRSSWQKIETDCERGDAGRIKNLFCSFSNRKYVVFS